MSKADKEYMLRRQGMVYAYGVIKEKGLEEFAKEMKRRGLLKIDITITDKEMQEAFVNMGDNMFNNMLPLFYSNLIDSFGFDKNMLHALHDKFKAEFDNIMSLDYMGEHYVTLNDYQKEMNEKYGFNFDMSIGEKCQSAVDESSKQYHYVKLETLIDKLERDGYVDASLHIKKMIGE